MSPDDVIEFPGQPGKYGRRALVEAWQKAGSPPINEDGAGRLYATQKWLFDQWQAHVPGYNPADNPDETWRPLAHVRFVGADINPTPARVKALTAAGLVRPYDYEPWHWQLPGDVRRFALVTSLPTPTNNDDPKPFPSEEDKVKKYTTQDALARSEAGRILAPGGGAYVNTSAKAATSQASNVIGAVGLYDITANLYATGTPGDEVTLVAVIQTDPAGKASNSNSYIERFVLDAHGQLQGDATWKLDLSAVTKPTAVYLRIDAPAANKGPVKVSVCDVDAYLFAGA